MFVVVVFGHRSAFPVMFDVESIEKWWKSSLVFKVYCKSPAQKMVSDDIWHASANVESICFVEVSIFYLKEKWFC